MSTFFTYEIRLKYSQLVVGLIAYIEAYWLVEVGYLQQTNRLEHLQQAYIISEKSAGVFKCTSVSKLDGKPQVMTKIVGIT